MRGAKYGAAVGCGWLLGVASAHAAEWSVQPSLSWSVDDDSNRTLVPTDQAVRSDSGVLSTDWQFKRSEENTQLSVEASGDARRYSDPAIYSDVQEGSLSTGFTHTSEHMDEELTASIYDQSVLTSELYETGLIQGNIHRRSISAGASFGFARTELHELFVQLGFGDTRYQGALNQELAGTGFTLSELLPGYRFNSASFGERFTLSPESVLTVSAFGDRLYVVTPLAPGETSLPGGTSYEAGLQVEYVRSFTEQLHLDASVGESRRSVDGAPSTFGTDGSLALTRDLTSGHMGLSYTRSLMPYGIGSLVEVQQARASIDDELGPYLSVDGALTDIQNDATAGQIVRRKFAGAVVGLNWRTSEVWTLRTEVSAGWTQPFAVNGPLSIHEWRGALMMTWHPRESAASR